MSCQSRTVGLLETIILFLLVAGWNFEGRSHLVISLPRVVMQHDLANLRWRDGEKSSLALNLSCLVRTGRGWRDAVWNPKIGKQRPRSFTWFSWNVCPLTPEPDSQTMRGPRTQRGHVWGFRLTAPAETCLDTPLEHLTFDESRQVIPVLSHWSITAEISDVPRLRELTPTPQLCST